MLWHPLQLRQMTHHDSLLPSRLHLATNSVHFYINGAPVEWGARLRDYLIILIQVAAESGGPRRRRVGPAKKEARRLGETCPDNNGMDDAAGPGPAGPWQGFARREN